MNRKKVVTYILVYLTLGFVILNMSFATRFSGSASLIEILPTLMVDNLINLQFWLLVLIWPLYTIYFFLNLLSGNI